LIGNTARGSVTDRLDEQKLAMLRRWGEGLMKDDREEVRAAGRAILMLSDEVERLHIDLWHALDQEARPQATEAPVEEPALPYSHSAAEVGATLRHRLRAFADRSHKQ
jgi:hypothetical protein